MRNSAARGFGERRLEQFVLVNTGMCASFQTKLKHRRALLVQTWTERNAFPPSLPV